MDRNIAKNEGFVLLVGLTLGAVLATTGLVGLLLTIAGVIAAKKWILS